MFGDARLPARFWKRATESPGGCWLWRGASTAAGYGHFYDRAKHITALAHRVAYEAFVGPVPEGRELDHLCRMRACCNPSHLEPVEHRENILRGDRASMGAPRRAIASCPKGHRYDELNTYLTSDGRRQCRSCARSRDARRREARRA
jgi:hypothetical protein